MGFLDKLFGRPTLMGPDLPFIEPDPVVLSELSNDTKGPTPVPRGRVSLPDPTTSPEDLVGLYSEYGVMRPAWFLPLIPIIRRLSETNDDVGQALHNVCTLGNTGHRISFDGDVSAEDARKMREHLAEKAKGWAMGVSDIDGLVNRMLAQIIIGGALSNEWVPSNELTGIECVSFILPESIRFKLNDRKTKYLPFQKVRNFIPDSKNPSNLIELNLNTYRYFGYGGDGESPQGIPLYLNALEGLKTQRTMKKNIDFISEQLGIMGFTTLYIEKPEMEEQESEEAYQARLEKYLGDAQNRAKYGFKDGFIVAYKDAHLVEFTSTTKDFEGVTKAFEQNETQIASGLKMDTSLMGRGYSSSETQITIIFTKLLSEMYLLQSMVASNLEFGYALELTLAGFKFKKVTVKFNRSTLQDELKNQQGREILIRNCHQLRVDGIINQDQYAEYVGEPAPAQADPVVPFDQQDGKPQPDPLANDQRQKGKDASDRKVREKNKPQGNTK